MTREELQAAVAEAEAAYTAAEQRRIAAHAALATAELAEEQARRDSWNAQMRCNRLRKDLAAHARTEYLIEIGAWELPAAPGYGRAFITDLTPDGRVCVAEGARSMMLLSTRKGALGSNGFRIPEEWTVILKEYAALHRAKDPRAVRATDSERLWI